MSAAATTVTIVFSLLASACGDDGVRNLPDAPVVDTLAPDAPPTVGQIGPPIAGEGAGDQAGTSIALSADGTRVIIGAPHNGATGADAGQARVFERNGDSWVQLGADLDGEAAGDRYGGAVAMSDDGSRVAVGSYSNDGNGSGSGHVRVFELTGGVWTQLGADIDGVNAGDGHGWTLALSASGGRLVVGAPSANSVNGTAHVWELTAGAWVAVGVPIAGNHELGDEVDISDDGSRIAVSSPSEQSSDGAPGRVQVYEWSGSAWAPLGAAIVGAQPSAHAGGSIALSGPGDMIAIGSDTSDISGTNTGDVRVFRWNGTTWDQVGAALEGTTGSTFGTAVALSADGTRVFAGGPVGAGMARLYTLAQDTWTQVTEVDFGSGFRTGAAVALSADGGTAAVGAPYADSPTNQSGEIRIYDLP